MGGGGLELSQLESVSYVETTLGKARALFATDRLSSSDVRDSAPAWVFVSYGQFQDFCMGCAVHYPPIYTTYVVVILKEGTLLRFGDSQQYDLSELGTPQAVAASVLQQYCVDRVDPAAQARYCGAFAP